MPDGEVREVPIDIRRAKGLERTLRGHKDVGHDPRQEEGRGVTPLEHLRGSSEGQEQIAPSRPDWDHHPHAKQDRCRLQPPGDGAEDEVVGPDQRVEEDVRPEAQDAERVGVDGAPQDPWDRVVGYAERQHGEPHAHRGMHVVALDHDIPEAVLVQGDVGRGEEDREKAERPQDVPVRDVKLWDGARGDGHVRVHAVEDKARGEYHRHRPDPLAILLGPPRHAYAQGDKPGGGGRVPQGKRDARERRTPQRGT